MKTAKISVYILSKNEESNISRCLDSLSCSEWPVYVLDSGSTDKTKEIVQNYSFAQFLSYDYKNHCIAYNEIIENLSKGFEFAIILDSDMALTSDLISELNETASKKDRKWQALDAEIKMYIEGCELSKASLYPPKPFVFKTGKALFVSTGHAEKLIDGACVERLKNKLIHDDRKSYSSYLQSQFRYSKNLIDRYREGNVSGRDKIRVRWPFLILAVPFFSLVVRRGFMDGRAGVVYALDRLIAEAVMYRQALASRLNKDI